MSMRKGIIIGIVVIALLSRCFASHVWASGNQQPDARGLAGVKPGELILQQKAGEGDWRKPSATWRWAIPWRWTPISIFIIWTSRPCMPTLPWQTLVWIF